MSIGRIWEVFEFFFSSSVLLGILLSSMGGTPGLGITVQGSEGGASGGAPDTTGWLWRKQGGVNGQLIACLTCLMMFERKSR